MPRVTDILKAGDMRVLFVDVPVEFKVNDVVRVSGKAFHALPGTDIPDSFAIRDNESSEYPDEFFMGAQVELPE